MKKLGWAVIMPILLAAGGCVQMSMETVVDKDGSGTCTLGISMSTDVSEALKELAATDGNPGMAEVPEFGDLTREKAEASAARYNCKVKKFERTTADEQEKLEMVLAFDDVQDLSRAVHDLMSEDESEDVMAVFKTDDGNYVLASVEDVSAVGEEKSTPEESQEKETEEAKEMDPEQMQRSMELMGKLMAHMSEFDVRMAITVPGEILESNAPETEGQTAIWHINSENMMSMQDQEFEPEIKFSGQGVKIKAMPWEG
jgi:hypothetical protein